MAAAGGNGAMPDAGVGRAPASSIHHDIARQVGQQVEEKIREAKYANETKVSQELQRIKQRMEALSDKIRLVSDRVQKLDADTAGAGGVMKKDELQWSIAKLEEVWEGEVGKLKHELWQTIQAHNHNADLIKHHKDAIDGLQTHMDQSIAAAPEQEHIVEQLALVDKVMQREQARQTQIDALMHRLQAVQHQLTLVMAPGAGGAAGWAGGAGMGLGGMGPGAAAVLAAQAQLAASASGGGGPPGLGAQAAGKKAAKKKPQKPAAAKPSAAGVSAHLRAEAPEFVPTAAPGLEGWDK